MQTSRSLPCTSSLAVASSRRSPPDTKSLSAPRRQARCSTGLHGRAAVLVSASTAVSPADLAAQPLASSGFVIRTYGGTNRYGKQLWQMKAHVASSGDFRSEDEKRICLAIAMQEDNLMAAHDEQKDGKGLATNLGLYNLSLDLILDSGYSGDLDFHKWNVSLEHTKDATSIILDYLRGDAPRKNIPRTCVNLPPAASGLNFIRGGQSGYEGYTPSGFAKATWDAELLSYRQAIATIVDQMARDTSLMGDNRRVDICCDHI